jgi:hypothetical protein
MKSYTEFLRGYIGKKGHLYKPDAGWPYFLFIIKKSAPDSDNAKLIDVGMDFAEFSVANGYRFVPLNLLVLDVE